MTTRTNRKFLLLPVLFLAFHFLSSAQGIRPYEKNPFYWEFRGNPCQRDCLRYVRDRLIEKQMVRPINNIKIYSMRAGNRYLTPRLAVDRMFVHLWGGVATVRFHRPTSSWHGKESSGQSIFRPPVP